MTVTPLFYGRVLPGVLLVMDRPRDYRQHLKSLAGQFVEVLVRKQKQKRSEKANAFYWAVVVPEIAEASGFTKDEAHDALKFHLLREDGDGPLVKVKSTADLSVEEFSAYTEQCQALGAQMFGIVWD